MLTLLFCSSLWNTRINNDELSIRIKIENEDIEATNLLSQINSDELDTLLPALHDKKGIVSLFIYVIPFCCTSFVYISLRYK